jgi:cytochrome c oxidase assembly protein subunit 15
MTDHPSSSIWLHLWAVLTVCATVVLMGLGSMVTNFNAGMADQGWPTNPLALAQMTPEQHENVPLVIEHSHRAAGYAVGILTIVLTVWLWLGERRRWICWLGTAAFVGVCIQGVLGGFRVIENPHWGTEFKIFHGCFAPVVLGLLVAVATATSRAMQNSPGDVTRLRRAIRHVLGAIAVQIVLGVFLRHTYNPVVERIHMLFAFVVAIGIFALIRLAWTGDRSLRRAAIALICLLALQLLFGVEVWITQLGQRLPPEMLPITAHRVAMRTAHVLGGSLVMAATVVMLVLSRRGAASSAQPMLAGAPREEAA